MENMKKQRIAFLPEIDDIELKLENTVNDKLKDILPGRLYRIGKPSNKYYEHLYPILEPGKLTLDDLEEFRTIEGTLIVVNSIIHMSKGNRIGVLRRYDELRFLGKFEKIFAIVDKSIEKCELVAIDIETQRNIEVSALRDKH